MNKNTIHILVVDDDDRIRGLVKQYLEENNFLVTTAKDAIEAKKKLEIVKFDILVLDIMMPGESGLTLTKEVKKNSYTPIILLTAKGETKDRIEGLELGADDYLGKPFEPKELLLRIKNILNKTKTDILPNEIHIGNALINLKKLLTERNLKTIICNTVHDSIVLDVYPEEEEKAIKTLKEAMMSLSNECEKRYGFKYTMPIGIELKLGDDWLNMKEVYKTNG